MLFLLDILLSINLWIAYRYFKNLASPPILMGAGMLAASLMATSYYTEWEMNKMLPISVFIIGGGTLFFTFCCMIFSRSNKLVKCKRINGEIKFPIKKIRIFILVSIAIGCLGILLKIYYLKQTFGSLGISELIIARRMDEWNGTNDFYLPSFVRQFGSYTTIVSNFTIWLIALMLNYKNTDLQQIKKILLIHIFVIFIDGMLSGSKAPILNVFMQFGIFFLFDYYALKGNFHISRKVYVRLFISLCLLALSFRGLSLLIGRDVENRTNTDLLAEYCGAEIKNFDIFMHESNISYSHRWGEHTFYSLYKEIDPNFSILPGEFQFIGNHSLGNVYTQYRSFYEDWGMPGVFFMNFVIAIISMFFYEKSKEAIISPFILNANLLIYTSMAMSIFMAFFSSKFTESIIRLGWLRSVIYILVMVWFLKKYVLRYGKS